MHRLGEVFVKVWFHFSVDLAANWCSNFILDCFEWVNLNRLERLTCEDKLNPTECSF